MVGRMLEKMQSGRNVGREKEKCDERWDKESRKKLENSKREIWRNAESEAERESWKNVGEISERM